MRLALREMLAVRHSKLREAIRAAGLDGLVITHLPNLFYLTNFLGTAGIAVVTGDRLRVLVDFRYDSAVKALWASPYGCPDADIVPVDRTYDEALVTLLKKLQPPRLGIEGSNVSVSRAHQLAGSLGAAIETGSEKGSGGFFAGSASKNPPDPFSGITLVATEGMVERLRLVKDAHEVDMLRRGGLLLSAVALDVIRDVKPGLMEQDVAATIDWRIKSAGFERTSFETIVASGPNSALPHAHAGDRVMQAGDLIVLDFGGVYGGYCVDLSRTVALGEPDAEMLRVYNAVLEAQNAAIAAVKPAVHAGDIDAAARDALGRHNLAEAFGHSTGHGLGVEIHEAPRVGPRREPRGDAPVPPDEVIEPGMVFTIEPGAYLPGWGGVRIEDDVLVTSDGVEVLTNVPRELPNELTDTQQRMDFDEINRILQIVHEHELSEFELEREGFKIKIKKGSLVHASVPLAPPAMPHAGHAPVPAPAAPPPAPQAVPGPDAPAPDEVDLAIVKSPIVGTFFRAAEPGAPAFVDVGDTVKKGQVLCIIEAMKLMNEIDSEFDGEIVKVYVENGQPVQYGERLFAIKARGDV